MRQTEIQITDIGIKLQALLGTYSFTIKHYNEGSFIEIKTSGSIEPHEIMPIIGDFKASIFAEKYDVILRVYEPITE